MWGEMWDVEGGNGGWGSQLDSDVAGHEGSLCAETLSCAPSLGETVWLCDYPGCNKPCFVEYGSHRMHDYCGRTHAQQHKEMLESSQRQQRGKGRQQDSHNSGTTQGLFVVSPVPRITKGR